MILIIGTLAIHIIGGPYDHHIIELVADLLIDYSNTHLKNFNLVYYAHYGHISYIYKYIRQHYTEVLYSYDSNVFSGSFCHCMYSSTQRICDQNYLLNITPYVIQPYQKYYKTLISVYDQTVKRLRLNEKPKSTVVNYDWYYF